jgi:carboxypeptidase Q
MKVTILPQQKRLYLVKIYAMRSTLFVLISLAISLGHQAQVSDSLFIRRIFDEALVNGKSYEDLRSLCKDVGARLSGSSEAEMAIYWGEQKLKSYGFDKVYLQPIEVPHWERGTKEVAWIKHQDGSLRKVALTALGGSVGTDGKMEGELVYFNTFEDLKKSTEKEVKNKIVFINQPMDEKQIVTFSAYGGCWPMRHEGAIEGSKKGAKAVLIRSIGSSVDHHPHTGSMAYRDEVKPIPGAAISTADSEYIKSKMGKEKLSFIFEMNCETYPPKPSFNVIGELTGSTYPNEIITVGGHLDSWDLGEGAHDDGAGIVHSIEALRILKKLGYKSQHTLRVVLFMNEENGNMGGKTYASWVKEKGEEHVMALESDRGGFAPRGFSLDGPEHILRIMQSFSDILAPYELHKFEKGYGGVDINPLKDYFPGIPLFGFVPDSQRYFDFHHAETDVFESVNKRELELGCASIASFLYLMDKALAH